MDPLYYNLEYLAKSDRHYVVRYSDKGLEVMNSKNMTPKSLNLSFKEGQLRAPGFKCWGAYSEEEAKRLFPNEISMKLYEEEIGIDK